MVIGLTADEFFDLLKGKTLLSNKHEASVTSLKGEKWL